ncbi:P-loop NTPase fold protein [Brevundimonas kwangchunensis]|uniref:P-loop NTPase fold protein n=1 Tax=Brevundimonas kwangchunensis TaxID=322163 RepID=A0ABN1GLY8_9CAUL
MIIEDLDRFNNTEVFVTLREINSLINANVGVKRKIRFLYALRDDMFINTDRTKFFEFIVPVIPIINSSNSIDKVLEQEERLTLAEPLDRQFLREVSRYLNDLRLIQNIFNEYAVYIASLETSEDKVLDPNKLLAVLIYKNVFPQDFENLHRGRGVLAGILNRHDELITLGESQLKDEISDLEDLSDRAQRQVPADMQELARLYAMSLIEKLPAMTTRVGVDASPVSLSELSRHDLFESIIEAQRIYYWDVHGNRNSVDISGLQSEIDPSRSYRERKEEIQAKSTQNRVLNSKIIQDLRTQISSLRTAKFNEIVRLSPSAFDTHFDELGEDSRLAKFLVFEGFLDDTYYQYTSLFHKGRLSPNDNKFLIQIRGFSNPASDFQIDNPKEVIAAMREDDFGQAYVLNVKIVDCLLSDPPLYASETTRAVDFISGHFEQSEAFLATYYSSGVEVPTLLGKLTEAWPEFVPTVLVSPNSLEHVANLVARLPSSVLQTMPDWHPTLSEYVSANLPSILSLGIDVDPDKLALLNIEISDLSSIENFPGVARFLFEMGLYSLTPANLNFVFSSVLGLHETEALATQNYSTALRTDSDLLRSNIEKRFVEYFKNVLLRLDGNSEEDVPAIIAAIAHEGLDDDDIAAFLTQQTALLPSLAGTPDRLHPLIVQLGRIEPVWANCIAFLKSEAFDAEILTTYLNQTATLDALGRQPVPDGEVALDLRKFLIEDEGLGEDAYRTYIKLLPRKFRTFPENISEQKLRILVEDGAVSLSPEAFDRLGPYADLQLLFVADQIDVYLADAGSYSVDDDFREKLLGSNIPGEQKLSIVRSMDLSTLSSLPSRARAVGEIIAATEAEDVPMLDATAAQAVILAGSTPATQIALFNTFQASFDKDVTREILSQLPRPFSEISTGHHIPILDMNDQNLELARWLKAKDVISSWSEGLFGRSIRINLFRR